MLRACVVGSRTDRIVERARRTEDDYEEATVVAADAPWVLVAWFKESKYYACEVATLTSRNVTTGRIARRHTGVDLTPDNAGCLLLDLVPRRGGRAVFTTTGVPVWLRGGVLRTIDRGGEALSELDRGAITDLRAEGEAVRWRRDGVDHEVEVNPCVGPRDVAVDRTGARQTLTICGTVVRRAPRGTAIRTHVVAGGNVVWIETDRREVRVHAADGPLRRPGRVVVLDRRDGGPAPRVRLAATSGTVAATAGRRLVTWWPGDPERSATLPAPATGLALDADVVRVTTAAGLLAYDQRSRRLPRACGPAAPAPAEPASAAEGVIAGVRRDLEHGGVSGSEVVEACARMMGRAFTLTRAPFGFSAGTRLAVAGTFGTRVAVLRHEWAKGDAPGDCVRPALLTFDVAGDVRRELPLQACPGSDGAPRPGELVVVTQSGLPAWVEDRLGGRRLVAIDHTGATRVLSPKGPERFPLITTNGDTVHWIRGGMDQSAPL